MNAPRHARIGSTKRRATTYVEAIDMLERHMKVLANLDLSRRTPRFDFDEVRVNDETD
jgi:hypothetical protein